MGLTDGNETAEVVSLRPKGMEHPHASGMPVIISLGLDRDRADYLVDTPYSRPDLSATSLVTWCLATACAMGG